MGAGYHGGFGSTKGSSRVIVADSSLVGNGRGFQLKEAAKRVKKNKCLCKILPKRSSRR